MFPSRTDTFGLVMLEALASGVPVAAFRVPGPLDVIGDAPVGVLDDDLRTACLRALAIPRAECRAFACRATWADSARSFLTHVHTVHRQARHRPAPTGRARAQALPKAQT